MNADLREFLFEFLEIERLGDEMTTIHGRDFSIKIHCVTMTFIQILFRFWVCFQPDSVQFFQYLIFGIEVSCVNVYNPTLATAFQFTTSTVVDMPGIDDIASVNIICQLFENESVQFVKIFSGNIDICSRFIVLT